MKTKMKIATLILIIISGTAFFAGFMQENTTSTILAIQDEITEYKDGISRMEAKALYRMETDTSNVYRAIDLIVETNLLDMEFGLLNSSLTPEEREVYFNRIVEMLFHYQGMHNLLLPIHLYRHFNVSSGDYVIASKDNDGYDYNITYSIWQEYVDENGLPVMILTPDQLYGHYFSYPLIQQLPLEQRPSEGETGKEIFILEPGGIEGILEYFLFSPLYALQDEISRKTAQITALEAQRSRLGLGVSLTTAAMVLATAMMSRLEQKQLEYEFSKLRTPKDPDVIIKQDVISILILIIALIISLVGIGVPLIQPVLFP